MREWARQGAELPLRQIQAERQAILQAIPGVGKWNEAGCGWFCSVWTSSPQENVK